MIFSSSPVSSTSRTSSPASITESASGTNPVPSRRIEIDLAYVEGWSLRGDLAILARTLAVVLGRKGTYKGATGGFDLPPLPAGADGGAEVQGG